MRVETGDRAAALDDGSGSDAALSLVVTMTGSKTDAAACATAEGLVPNEGADSSSDESDNEGGSLGGIARTDRLVLGDAGSLLGRDTGALDCISGDERVEIGVAVGCVV